MAYSVEFVTGGSGALVGMSANVNLPDIVVSESTFVIPAYTAILTLGTYNTKKFPQAGYVSGSSSWQIYIDGTSRGFGSYAFGPLAIGGSSSGWLYTTQSGTTAASSKINTSNIFNSRNPTSRTAAITLTGSMNANNSISQMYWNGSFTGTGTVTLNAPPTFRVTDSGGAETTQLYFDKQFVYAGLTTASVKVANLSAKYGGTITSATLTIGDQTVSKANPVNGDELSILLNAGGTFKSKVTVTDSRGQTKSIELDNVTVNVYTTPTVNFEVQRTLATGVPDDEGTYVVINPKFTFVDVIAELQAPTITATDEGSITYSPTVTWYSSRAQDGTLSGSVTWSSLSTGDTVYGLLSLQSGFDTLQSYQISVTPIDSEGTGTAKTQMLAPAFFTIDVLAGGHGIAFGKPASNEGFECAMEATFEDMLTAQDMTQQEIDDFVNGLNVGGGGTAVDLVIEQGTDTATYNGATFIWTYRKWLSGFAEAWTYKESATNSGGDWQTSAYCPKLFEYTSQISVQATGWASGNANGGVRHAHPMQNSEYGGWLIDTWLRNGNANTSCGISWYITGRWK